MTTYKHKINYYETDKMGITHHSNYVRFMEEARIDFLEQIGWPFEKLENEGIISPVISIECNYKKTTTFANLIQIQVSVAKLSACKLTFSYVFTVNDEIVFTATSSHCFLDEKGLPVLVEQRYPKLFQELKKHLQVK